MMEGEITPAGALRAVCRPGAAGKQKGVLQMGNRKMPDDRELFPQLGQGTRLHDDYITEAEKLRPAAAIPEMDIKDRGDYGIFLRKLIEQCRQLSSSMERWLVERLLEGGVVDSFPPNEYLFNSFSMEITETTTTYDPYWDTEEESVHKDKDDLTTSLDQFSLLMETMLLFKKEKEDRKEQDNGTRIYQLMKPIYQVTHMETMGQEVKRLFPPILFTAACLLLAWGAGFLSDVTVDNPFISVPIVLLGLGLILAAVCGGIWTIVRIFGFFKSLGKILSRPKIVKQAASNAPKAYRILRYYRLWEQSAGKNYAGVTLMGQYLEEYWKKYPGR